ncbi:MAG: FAD:protein FMN transferase [Steroidobacteraceae bacterium]
MSETERGCRRFLTAFTLLLVGAASAQAHGEWLFRETAIMGTRCAVELWTDDRAHGLALIDDVFAEMRRIDALMSTYKPESELSRLNARAGRRPVQVSAELFDLIETAVDYSRVTHGAFDITYASVGYLYDFRSHKRPGSAAIATGLANVDYRKLKFSAGPRTLAFMNPGMRIDLGGIAKGYAVDRGIAILQRAGVKDAMVNAGGDTRILGDRRGQPWMVGVRDPNDRDKVALRIPLENASISTSGDYERFFDEGGVRYHHIIDPKTGDSARALRSATVIATTSLRADALSTSVFVLGPERGIELINELGDVDAVVVTPEGKLLYSNGLAPP